MSDSINNIPARTGRVLKEDGTFVNEGDGKNADGSQKVSAALPLEVSGSASAVNLDVIPSTNVSQCTDITVQLSGTYAAAVSLQGSNDEVTWTSVVGQSLATNFNFPATQTGSPGIMFIPTPFKFFRARITSYTSGTVSGMLIGNKQPTPNMLVGGGMSVTGSTSAGTKTSGGATGHRRISTADTNLQNVKSAAGVVYSIHAMNTAATARYLKLYNKSIAPVLASDVPVMTILLPVGPSMQNISLAADVAANFSLGISYAITGAAPDTDATAIAAGDIYFTLLYS